MSLKEMIANVFRKNERVKEIIEERRAQRLAEQRDKPSNERELERFYEEARQERIKQQLAAFRKQRLKETWGSDMMKKDKIFKEDRPILKEKNIFKGSNSKVLNSNMGFLR